MVAPFTSGRIARSMVRVTGSGTNENADPICLNLGNVSNFAAMIPVPQTLSFNNHNRRPQVKSSFNYKSKLSPVNMPTIEEMEKPTSQLPNDTDKLDDSTTDDSPRPLPINTSSTTTQTMDSTAVRGSEVSVSSPAATPSGDRNRSSRKKRTAQKEYTKDSDASSPPKRHRSTSTPTLNTSHGSALPTLSQGATNINWILPTGMLAPNGSHQAPNGSIQSMPIVLPIASGSNTPLAMPMRMVQLNNQATPVILANGNMNGKASPAFVLQANGSNAAAAAATPAVPNIQPTPVLMVPTQSLPLLFPSEPNRDLQQMAQERNQLKKENESLKYRLFRFHQLLRNKEKLMTVLRNLEAVQS